MARTRILPARAAIACVALSLAAPVLAQDAAPPANPPAATTPPSTTTTPPAATTTTPPSTGQKLPDVEVIQQQPKPTPKPVKQANKPKKKPAPVVQAAPPAPPATPTVDTSTTLPELGNVKMSPIGGSEIPIAKVPGSVTTMSSEDIKRDGSVMAEESLQQRVPGVILSDLQGNQFQTDIQYRGFEASPVNGVAQGLAIYQNGVRINESFGDTINWDFLPSIAINNITVMSGNPVFGLNALGGAVSIDMKDGFNFQGADIDTRFGSFGRKQVSTEAGMRSGAFAMYGAFEAINDDGFRDFSDASIRRGYADLGIKTDSAEFHFNFTGADNNVGVTAAAPETLLALGRNLTFSSPQTTENIVQMYSVNGQVQATKDITLSGVTYYRHFSQKHQDGNLFDDPADCGASGGTPGTLCSGDDQVFDQATGQPIGFDPNAAYGSIDATSQNADGAGISLQAVDKARLFGYKNQFTVGVSYDRGHVGYTADSQLGTFGPKFVVAGTGIILDGSDDFNPRALTTTNDYFGAFFTDTIDLTDRLALTVGGRYNYARIEIDDASGGNNPELNGVNKYTRFNPSAGLTYEFSKAFNWYGGYSEANRAPVAAELACADPNNPCLIESFLTADPPLKQVVSHTWETGFRGTIKNWTGEQYDWGVGLFRTLNTDDIFDAASTNVGHGFFQNIGDTLRQGVEANISYRSQRLFWYANYTYTDPTFQSDIPFFPSPNHPGSLSVFACDPSDPDTVACIDVHKGDTIPGIPRHTFKAGIDYWMTPKWKVGGDFVGATSQFFFGDENNTSSMLQGYGKVDLHTSYDITDHVQVYGLIQNLFDKQYALYGTYFSVDDANSSVVPPGTVNFTDANNRTVTPAIPFAAYGGVKVKF